MIEKKQRSSEKEPWRMLSLIRYIENRCFLSAFDVKNKGKFKSNSGKLMVRHSGWGVTSWGILIGDGAGKSVGYLFGLGK